MEKYFNTKGAKNTKDREVERLKSWGAWSLELGAKRGFAVKKVKEVKKVKGEGQGEA